ncbi:MAG: UDP-N-acetylmuramate--L-alanine ligase, partial [Desulfatiglandales bacterium]
DPTVIVGGRLNVWGGANARLGEGDILVAEADESDGSFLRLSPTLVVVTNIDREHMDYYGSMERLRSAFVDFINSVPFYGKSFLCLDDPELQRILPRINRRFITYGLGSQAQLRALEIRLGEEFVEFSVLFNGELLGTLKAGMPGEHNVRNALAAVGIGMELGIPFEKIREGLKDLGGLHRRFQKKGEAGGILFLDDYGHHPTEIETVLKTAKDCYPHRRLVVIFQPHRYSRTKDLFERFATSFYNSDLLFVCPIYPAGESPIEGVDHHALKEEIRRHGHREVHCLEGLMPEEVLEHLREGDVLLTLGAGDVWKLGEEILKRARDG